MIVDAIFPMLLLAYIAALSFYLIYRIHSRRLIHLSVLLRITLLFLAILVAQPLFHITEATTDQAIAALDAPDVAPGKVVSPLGGLALWLTWIVLGGLALTGLVGKARKLKLRKVRIKRRNLH